MKFGFLVIVLLAGVTPVFAQPSNRMGTPLSETAKKTGSMKGRIIEQGSNAPLEYANIAVYSAQDSSLSGGGIAGTNGEFVVENLKPGVYYIDAKFIGYEHTKKENIRITDDKPDIDLGAIALTPASENLQEVNVVAQNRPIAYEIDKKVIDPTQFPTAAGGTATDILANTPSVVVDIEGNVTLRGSSDFTVLIDGKPTPFDPEDALDQIPASTIQNIEIITNPSAKYDPDGNAGIINIKTKKSKLVGLSGIVNATADTYGSLTGDFLLNHKMNKFNFFVSGNRSVRYHKGTYNSISETYDEDTLRTESDGNEDRNHSSWSVKSGFDYFMNDKNTLSFNVSLNGRDRTNTESSYYTEFTNGIAGLYTLTKSSSEGKSKNVAFSLDYKKTFETEGQELTAYIYYETGTSDELSRYNQNNVADDSLIEGQKGWEDGDGKQFRFKTDYVQPLGGKAKIETGYQLRLDRDFEWNDVHWYYTADDYEPSSASEYYTETNFDRDIHSLYGIFSNAGSVLGYQFGLRTEYTNRSLDFSGDSEKYKINRWDFFPATHFSVNLPSDQQMTLSYTRRIQRPRSYYLEPFKTYVDAYTIRVGNPEIKPEYIDSYELGYQKQVGKGFLSVELYHRKTNNKIERITSVYSGNVMLRTIDNIGKDYSTGLELMLNMQPASWWMANLMGNAYYYKVIGEIDDESIDEQSNNWHARLGNTFALTKTTKLQIDAMYHSPSTTAQGRREGFLFTNLAMKQELFDKKLNATLSVRDLLNTAKFEFENSGSDFYTKRKIDMKSPVFALTLSYKLNNYRAKKTNGTDGNNENGEMMDVTGSEF